MKYVIFLLSDKDEISINELYKYKYLQKFSKDVIDEMLYIGYYSGMLIRCHKNNEPEYIGISLAGFIKH